MALRATEEEEEERAHARAHLGWATYQTQTARPLDRGIFTQRLQGSSRLLDQASCARQDPHTLRQRLGVTTGDGPRRRPDQVLYHPRRSPQPRRQRRSQT